MIQNICCGKRDNVASSELLDRLDRFATLATRLDFHWVAGFPLGSHPCHPCHVEKMRWQTESLNDSIFRDFEICLRWLSIAIEEGHLEPSQRCVGRIVGWPQRVINKNSLWTDFFYWYYKDRISIEEIPDQWMFYDLLDRIFIPHLDRYEIPALEDCRKILVTLRLEYECH